MMSRYERDINVDYELNKTYDACKNFFSNIGYLLINASFPSLITFSKKGNVWTATDYSEYSHNITILFEKNSDSNTLVKIQFYFPDLIGKIKDKHMKSFEPIFLAFQNEVRYLISNKSDSNKEDVIKKEIIIERQTIKVRCHYCGSLNDEGRGTCESCGAKL